METALCVGVGVCVQSSQGPAPLAAGAVSSHATTSSQCCVKAELASPGANVAELRRSERSHFHSIGTSQTFQ